MAFKRQPMASLPEAKTYTPTDEQVFNKDLILAGHNVKIIAGAGTGKSSSLRYNAESISNKNFLVLCFNAANAKESNEHPDRPENIYYSTIHSVAYREIVDFALRKRLGYSLMVKDLYKFDIKGKISAYVPSSKYDIDYILHRQVLDAITGFCRSMSTDIESYSKSRFYYLFIRPLAEFSETNVTEGHIDALAKIASLYWESLTSKSSSDTITHDVYLKMYQLQNKKITTYYDKQSRTEIPIDILCGDEWQDTNPVSEAIFSTQTQQKVIVGDPMQQLYAWRGAGDAMNNFEHFKVGKLTESFRFNKTIAVIANTILQSAGSSMYLKGSGKTTEINTKAHLCRTNASVIMAMLPYLGTSKRVYTSIDMKNTFSKLYHMQACYFNDKPMYPCGELAHIVDRESLESAMRYSDELVRLDKLRQVLTMSSSLTDMKKALDKIIIDTPALADIVISTGHASKGMEYDEVTVDGDFITDMDKVPELFDNEALYCLLYVMVTRAKVKVNLPEYLEEVLL